jgi:hypothetical protein
MPFALLVYGEFKRGYCPSSSIFPFEGEGDKGDRVDKEINT